MSVVRFIADLHLGHKNMAIKRGFQDESNHIPSYIRDHPENICVDCGQEMELDKSRKIRVWRCDCGFSRAKENGHETAKRMNEERYRKILVYHGIEPPNKKYAY